ncbi:ribosomal biogenesis protein LAS1L-like isoform X2 [Xenia sp. Carnegie-2017]|uniref:ribosomal biogenesis protein LAS1L-like isoform X2 n=1 Tax=Xenia sp. Carnegie-2017 TaxID=2897299 RepID=UPI001F04D978|nr:ribosomal biogenesis protein LAS1L-like isoform X2 [Xenia sp. Carnegie-2017]
MLRIVPWSSRDEWLTTYNDLYNFENIDQQIEGLNRVEAWKSRSGSKLPLAVESTASLIAAGVEDVRSVVNANVIRHTMAMALVRFVSGIVDMEQKHAYARSMQSIADDIGLPDWLVDLRHEAIHASLPSMQVVRAGCRFALEWLKEHYWDSQIKEFADRDKALTLLLQDYAKCFDDAKKKKNFGIKSKMKIIIHEIQDLVSKFNMWHFLFRGEKCPQDSTCEQLIACLTM